MKPIMFYLIEKHGELEVVPFEGEATDGILHLLERAGIKVYGQFGRLEYAELWKHYYMGELSHEELRARLQA